MIGNHAVRNLVREGKTSQLRNVVATHQGEGMQTLEMDLTRLVAEGTLDLEAARDISLHPREVTAPPPPPEAANSLATAARATGAARSAGLSS
jgi:twitching motility protein PilT